MKKNTTSNNDDTHCTLYLAGRSSHRADASGTRHRLSSPQAQMAALFGKERSVITKHIGTPSTKAMDEQRYVQILHTAEQHIRSFTISVLFLGYRASQRGVSSIDGHVVLGYLLRGGSEPNASRPGRSSILKRAEKQLDASQV